MEASYSSHKIDLLDRANKRLECLRYLVRMANDLHCLRLKQYGYASVHLNDIGKEVGGWLRQQRARPPSGTGSALP